MDVPRNFRRLHRKKSAARPSQSTTKGHMHDESDDKNKTSTTCVQQRTSRCRARGNISGVSQLYFMITRNEEIKNCVDKTRWTQFLFENVANSDPTFVFACVKSWSARTHTFQLPAGELGITPYDFTTLTGIAVGMGIKLPPYSDSQYGDYGATINSYFPGFDQFQADYKHGALRVSVLSKYITCMYNGGNILVSVEVISRAFCMYMLGHLFFPNGGATTGIGWLNYLIDMNEVGTYDWGTAILARIYLSLNCHKQKGMNGLSCFWQLIEYCLSEYLSKSGAKLLNPSDQSWPRILRWRKDNRTSAPAAQKQLELGSPQSILWTTFLPFRDKFPYVIEAYNLSVTRHLLLDPQCGAVYYLGERCVRQLTGLIVIPVDPPTPMTYTDPAQLQFLHMNTEELKYDKLSRQASQCEYDAYYSSLVCPEAPSQCAANTAMPEIVIPIGPTPTAKGVKNHKQSFQSGKSIASVDTLMPDWMMPSLEPSGNVIMVSAPRPDNSFEAPSAVSYSKQQWREVYVEYVDYSSSLWQTIVDRAQKVQQQTLLMEQKDVAIQEREAEIARLRQAQNPF